MDGFFLCIREKIFGSWVLLRSTCQDGRLDRVLANNDNLDSVRQQLAATFLAFAEARFWAVWEDLELVVFEDDLFLSPWDGSQSNVPFSEGLKLQIGLESRILEQFMWNI